jgi:hypothetical protein
MKRSAYLLSLCGVASYFFLTANNAFSSASNKKKIAKPLASYFGMASYSRRWPVYPTATDE